VEWAAPPQALLLLEIGALCTAGTKAGWRSNKSLVRFGMLWEKKNEISLKSNTFKYYHRDCDYFVNILQYFMLFYKKCSEII